MSCILSYKCLLLAAFRVAGRLEQLLRAPSQRPKPRRLCKACTPSNQQLSIVRAGSHGDWFRGPTLLQPPDGSGKTTMPKSLPTYLQHRFPKRVLDTVLDAMTDFEKLSLEMLGI